MTAAVYVIPYTTKEKTYKIRFGVGPSLWRGQELLTMILWGV
jgi:hypothetical protein